MIFEDKAPPVLAECRAVERAVYVISPLQPDPLFFIFFVSFISPPRLLSILSIYLLVLRSSIVFLFVRPDPGWGMADGALEGVLMAHP